MVTDAETTPDATREPVRVEFDLPPRLVADYDRLVAEGIYLSRDEALRQAVLLSWYYERGTHHRVRLDLGPAEDETAAESGKDTTSGDAPAT